jgi:hypothetical protein
MKSNTLLPVLLLLFTVLPSTTGGISMASLPYPFNTWHANAKTYVKKQEDIQSYSLTVKIKHRAKTIKEQNFTAFDYKKIIDKALRYAKKEQTAGLKAIFKPSIRLVKSWDIYPLGNVVQPPLPTDPAERADYWKQVEQTVTDSFYVSSTAQHSTITSVKKVLSLGLIPLTLLSCLIIFLLGLVLLSLASQKRL